MVGPMMPAEGLVMRFLPINDLVDQQLFGHLAPACSVTIGPRLADLKALEQEESRVKAPLFFETPGAAVA
jgi:hypothetical protein